MEIVGWFADWVADHPHDALTIVLRPGRYLLSVFLLCPVSPAQPIDRAIERLTQLNAEAEFTLTAAVIDRRHPVKRCSASDDPCSIALGLLQ
jgi:hypothetical protein